MVNSLSLDYIKNRRCDTFLRFKISNTSKKNFKPAKYIRFFNALCRFFSSLHDFCSVLSWCNNKKKKKKKNVEINSYDELRNFSKAFSPHRIISVFILSQDFYVFLILLKFFVNIEKWKF